MAIKNALGLGLIKSKLLSSIVSPGNYTKKIIWRLDFKEFKKAAEFLRLEFLLLTRFKS